MARTILVELDVIYGCLYNGFQAYLRPSSAGYFPPNVFSYLLLHLEIALFLRACLHKTFENSLVIRKISF